MAYAKRYIEYMYPGLVAADTSTKELDGLDERHLQMPKGAVAWRTFERTAAEVDGEVLLGEIKNYSGWTYYGCRLSLAQVEHEMPNERILIDSMRGNGFGAVVQVSSGRTYQLCENDRVLQG